MMTVPHILFVIAPEQFRDEELFVPLKHMHDCGWQTTVASPRIGKANGMLGGSFPVEHDLSTLNPNDYHALVIVGGFGSIEWLWPNEILQRLIKAFDHNVDVLAAICLSGVALAKAGVLSHQKATVWPAPEALSSYEAHDVHYEDKAVVINGRYVTANGPEAAVEFARAIESAVSANISQSHHVSASAPSEREQL
jgi:protease I